MDNFVPFRWLDTGVIANYPEHYETHPVFGALLERYELGDDEFEEDKVVYENHEIPVDQRGYTVAKSLDEHNVEELKDILTERGLPTSGNKPELVARIVADNEETDKDNA